MGARADTALRSIKSSLHVHFGTLSKHRYRKMRRGKEVLKESSRLLSPAVNIHVSHEYSKTGRTRELMTSNCPTVLITRSQHGNNNRDLECTPIRIYKNRNGLKYINNTACSSYNSLLYRKKTVGITIYNVMKIKLGHNSHVISFTC